MIISELLYTYHIAKNNFDDEKKSKPETGM